MSICIVHNAGPHFIKKKNEVENKTVEEILQILSLEGYILAIENDKYWEPLKSDIIPLDVYPELVSEKTPELNTYPTLHLTVLNSDFNDKFARKVLINQQTDMTTFPPLTIVFTQSEYRNLRVSDLLQMIGNIFEYKHSDAKLCVDNAELNPDDRADSYIDSCKDKQLEFHCKIDEAAASSIKSRKLILEEISENERAFRNDLAELINYWKKNFEKKMKFSEAQIQSIFGNVEPIYNLHTELYHKLPKPLNFATCYGSLLLNYVTEFKIADTYISNFDNVEKLIKSCRVKTSLSKTLSKIEDENGRDFLSYYIAPIQHYPKYPIFLRKLNEKTPIWHPDKIYLERALVELILKKKISYLSERGQMLRRRELKISDTVKYLLSLIRKSQNNNYNEQIIEIIIKYQKLQAKQQDLLEQLKVSDQQKEEFAKVQSKLQEYLKYLCQFEARKEQLRLKYESSFIEKELPNGHFLFTLRPPSSETK